MSWKRFLRVALLATPAPWLAAQPLGNPPVPPGNPLTAAKIALGQALFFEEQLSLTHTVACATCHLPQAGGSDPRTEALAGDSRHPGPDGLFGTADDIRGSLGVPAHDALGLYRPVPHFGLMPQVGGRKAPSAINAAFVPLLLWDGRASGRFDDPLTGQTLLPNAAALESQAIGPLLDAAEMAPQGAQAADIAVRIRLARPLALATEVPATLAAWLGERDYPALFAEAFGTPEVTPARIAMAIASYERTLVSNQAPIDFDTPASPTLSPQENQGRQLFVANDCAGCHAGPRQTNDQFFYIGLRPVAEDLGRFVQTGNNADRGAFKVPSLRNVALRAPYMHTGGLPTLAAVVDFYARGGDFDAPNKDPRVRPRNLNPQQRAALVAFLSRPLTDPRVAAGTAPFERPRLASENGRVPQLIGSARAGSGGFKPRMIALEPPLIGDASVVVALSDALGGAEATLVVARTDPGLAESLPAGDVLVRQITLAGVGAGAGHGQSGLDLSLPGLAAGEVWYGRWYVADPAAAHGLAVSPAFRIELFGGSERVFGSGFEQP